MTDEAGALLGQWSGLLAGELYAARAKGRPRVFDLHAAMGGGALAQTDRLRFAAFDVLLDGKTDMQQAPYPDRVARLEKLLDVGVLLHCARCETVRAPAGAAALFERIVTRGGAEGLVLHSSDGRTFKVKPEISIDAAVIGYVGTEHGVSELLLALVTPSGRYQSIGRLRTGWSRRESKELATRLAASACASSPTADRRTMCRFVRPELVVEVRCNDLLATDSAEEPIRRMAFDYAAQTGWLPLGPFPGASMINPVFVRIRDDKQAQRPDVRFEQVTDLVPVAPETSAQVELPPSESYGARSTPRRRAEAKPCASWSHGRPTSTTSTRAFPTSRCSSPTTHPTASSHSRPSCASPPACRISTPLPTTGSPPISSAVGWRHPRSAGWRKTRWRSNIQWPLSQTTTPQWRWRHRQTLARSSPSPSPEALRPPFRSSAGASMPWQRSALSPSPRMTRAEMPLSS